MADLTELICNNNESLLVVLKGSMRIKGLEDNESKKLDLIVYLNKTYTRQELYEEGSKINIEKEYIEKSIEEYQHYRMIIRHLI